VTVESGMRIEQTVTDWPTVKKRWEAWWEGGLYDRPLIGVTAPRNSKQRADWSHIEPETQWTDIQHMIHRTLSEIDATYYGGDAPPCLWHMWSVGHALYLGCEPHFSWDTVWVDPAPVGEDGYPAFTEWRDSPWYRWMLDSTEAAVEASQGRYFVMPIWGNHAGDNLSCVRGTTQLMADIAFDPQWVKSAMKELSDIQIEVFEALWDRVEPSKLQIEGSVNYVGCWSPVRTMGFDCDISCMIGVDTFRDIILPPLIETMHTVDHRLYHLDGPSALHHLDTLLSIPELQVIQWVPGYGRESAPQWIPVLQRIQSAGKGVVMFVRSEEIEALLDEVRPEGLYIQTRCDSEDEARALLERVAARY
jgi:hypothetical protein